MYLANIQSCKETFQVICNLSLFSRRVELHTFEYFYNITWSMMKAQPNPIAIFKKHMLQYILHLSPHYSIHAAQDF